MSVTIESIKGHKQKYGATYMINLFGSIIPIVMFLVYASTQINRLSTHDDVNLAVTTAVSSHSSSIHPQSDARIKEVNGKIDSILLFQLEDRIEKLLRVICTNPGMRSELADAVRGLEQEYFKIAGRPYVRPSCEQLGV